MSGGHVAMDVPLFPQQQPPTPLSSVPHRLSPSSPNIPFPPLNPRSDQITSSNPVINPDHPLPPPSLPPPPSQTSSPPDPSSAAKVAEISPAAASSSEHPASSPSPGNFVGPSPLPPPPLNPPAQSGLRPPPSSSPQQPSYAQVIRGSRGPGFVRSHAKDIESFARLPRTGTNIICGSREGIPSFSFLNTDLPKVENLYSNALILKFHGGRPSLESSHKEISSWGIERPFTIGPMSSRAFLLRFQDEKDLLKVLSRPSSTLITFPYKVFRWHNLCHIKEDSCMAPVWISLPKLPLQCFIPEFLEAVGNKIGRFLCLDKATATLARPSAARLCVEIDLRKPPPEFIWVGLFDGIRQPILYDRLPKYCLGCHTQGHSIAECSKKSLDTPVHQPMSQQPGLPRSTPPVRQNVAATPAAAVSSIPTKKSHHPNTPAPSEPQASVPTPLSMPDPAPSSDQPELVPSNSANLPNDTPTSSNPQTQQQNPKPPSFNRSKTHLKSSLQTSRHSKAKPKKSVMFEQHLSNVAANQEFWDAVNRQMSILEQARLKASDVASSSKPPNLDPSDNNPQPSTMSEGLQSNQPDKNSPSESSTEDESCSASPVSSFQDGQDPYESSNPALFLSEGEEHPEPTSLSGHNSDDSLPSRPQSHKKNKRHPDQPLKVTLRARKDPQPPPP